MPNKQNSMNYKHIIYINDLSLISLQRIVVPPTGSGRAQTGGLMVPDSLFANFLIIIHETNNVTRRFGNGMRMFKK